MEQFEGQTQSKYIEAIYNSVEDNFMADGMLSEENLPLEFLSLARESISKSGVPDDGFVLLSEVLPEIGDKTPSIVKELAVIKNPEGMLKIVDRALFMGDGMLEPVEIDINLAPADEKYGNIIDAPRNLDVDRPSMPVAILSDDQLAGMEQNIRSIVGGRDGS